MRVFSYKILKNLSSILIGIWLIYFLFYLILRGCNDLEIIHVDFLFPYLDYFFWLCLGVAIGYRLAIRVYLYFQKNNPNSRYFKRVDPKEVLKKKKGFE